jgi:PAS domain S-box-containing protein
VPDLEDHKNELHNDQIKPGQSVSNPEKMFLSGSLKFYEDILQSLHKALIVVYNISGQHIEVWQSPDFTSRYGLSQNSFKNKSLNDVFAPQLAAEILKYIEQVFSTSSPISFELEINFPNGTFWFAISLSPLLDKNKRTSAVTGYFHDITSSYTNAEKGKEGDWVFRSLIESRPNAIVTTDINKQIIYVNPRFIIFAGGSVNDYTGKMINELALFQSLQKVKLDVIFTTVLNSGLPKSFEFICKQGMNSEEDLFCEALVSPVYVAEKHTGFQIDISNVTQRKKSEQKLIFSSQFYKRIVENMQEGILVIAHGKIAYCNAEALRILGKDSSSVLNKRFERILHEEDITRVNDHLKDVLSDMDPNEELQFRIAVNGNPKVWVQSSATIIEWENTQAVLLSMSDISSQHFKEEKQNIKIENLKLLSEKAKDFIDYFPQPNIFEVLGQKIIDYLGEAILIFITYHSANGIEMEHVASSKDYDNIREILSGDNNKNHWQGINPDYIKNLSIDKLIRFRDGHYEHGDNAFPTEILQLIEQEKELGEIYLIGLSWDNVVRGSLFILLPEHIKIQCKKTLESIVKFGSIALRRKEKIEIISKKEEKYRRIFESQQDIYYKLDLEGIIVEVGPAIEKVLGYTVDEVIGELAFGFLFKQESQRDLRVRLIRDGNIRDYDIQIISKDKSLIDISLNIIVVTNDKGQPVGYEGFLRDITKRKKSEKQLFDSEERFKALFYKSPDPLFVEDYNGNVLDANPAACRLYHYEKDQIVGMNVMELVPPNIRDTLRNDYQLWITGETKRKRSFALTSKGDIIPVELHASKVIYDGKKALLFIGRDITKISETERILKEAKEKAEQADKLKSVFLANMSHEIRTPMNAIVGFSEILSDKQLSHEEREEFIKYISQGSDTLMNLIEDIIDITKIEAGQITINYSTCSVTELMEELYAIFLKVKNKGDKKHLDLKLSKPVIDSSLSISTDPARVKQILSNLLGNALKFTEKGMIEFGFKIKNSNTLQFFVKDTGFGIPPEKLESIFERFVQIENGAQHKGTGLGLSISKKLAELLGGSLLVESEYGKGSEFILELPLSEDYIPESTQEKKFHITHTNWSEKKFLIAEDSALNYSYLEALFMKTKVKLIWAKDGREAVELCRRNPDLDLILMDIKMPVLDGLDAITEIRKFNEGIPIIVQTAYAMMEDRERSIAAGGNEHLTKPLNADELFSTLNKYLSEDSN